MTLILQLPEVKRANFKRPDKCPYCGGLEAGQSKG